MTFGDADAAMLTGDVFAVAVSYTINNQQQSGRGVLDTADGFTGVGADVQLGVRTTSLLVATGAFTGLASDETIVVSGTSYRISEEPMLEDDGLVTRLVLAAR